MSIVETNCTILNNKIDTPILIAPVAMQEMAHKDGEIGTAKAAARQNTIMTHSTISN